MVSTVIQTRDLAGGLNDPLLERLVKGDPNSQTATKYHAFDGEILLLPLTHLIFLIIK